MARCPVCESPRIVIVISPTRRAFCTACGARWIQEGSFQRDIRPFGGTNQPGSKPPSRGPVTEPAV